jgi:hypothetical protein
VVAGLNVKVPTYRFERVRQQVLDAPSATADLVSARLRVAPSPGAAPSRRSR